MKKPFMHACIYNLYWLTPDLADWFVYSSNVYFCHHNKYIYYIYMYISRMLIQLTISITAMLILHVSMLLTILSWGNV